MKKALILGVVLATVVWTMGLGAFVPVASAATLSAGDLIKASGAAVYFYAADGMRYTFPTQSTYMSWYSNFDGVKTITDDELSAIDLAGNVVIRPGTKLVKITTVPKVFAVQPNGSLAWIETADAAKALYGDNWASMVIDIPDGFWTNYTDSGMVIDGTEFPEGSLVKPEGGSDIYYVNADGSWSMIADETAFNANMWAAAFVVSTTMAVPSAGSDIAAAMDEVIDVSQGGGGGTGTIPASGGTLSVALASSTPGTQMVPKGATGVTLSTFDFTATGGAVTVNSLVAKHSNLGATNEISKLYVYEGDNKLSTGKTISSSTLEATFHNLGLEIASGATTKISLVADFSSTTTTYGYHELALASSSAVTLAAGTVLGSFPVTGNTAQVINTTIGAVDVERSTTSFIRKIGDKEQDLAKFTVYVN
ncbi:hypothetical protein HN803_07845, partial [candidate division WWE3 bacterium]|nr:hypothetical protein [candidate division WWE3 bacterium]